MSNVALIDDRVVVDNTGMPDPGVRQEIINLIDDMHDAIDEGKFVEADPPVRHIFSDGVYAREITMAKHMLVVGKIHKTSHINILSKGEVSIKTQFGIDRFKAPHVFVSQIGVQRVLFAHEDCVFTTIHPTDETDVDKIEAEVIAESYDEIPGIDGPPQKHIIDGGVQ